MGHIEYLNAASKLGEKLIVGLNSDHWLSRKKGKPFMEWTERFIIISHIKPVDEVIAFLDDDNSAIDCIKSVMELYPPEDNWDYIFANGGDRTNMNTPELEWWRLNKIKNLTFEFGVGGNYKTNSSSDLLRKWKHNEF